ncbi:MAG: hypothetical protein Hyperionvirus2_9 [Hyperionvirus sp.]|uniref:RING-type domain-containing protein n=1 Tax=Hyperionvirus sp. TaxID=2487770 RepID=A0A3G5A8Y7_9VIRU|nr:MAG: hypothetical protein Hyperionvirus2_9 [Hyperionvirus sp.]
MSYVLLQCVKEGSRLRVKMLSSQPFIKGINCQFPRALREVGKYFVVESTAITLKGKFYSAMKKNGIVCQTFSMDEVKKYIDGLSATDKKVVPKVIFGDDDGGDNECVICMSDPKDSVFSPCGHFMTCKGCSVKFEKCPMCRAKIVCVLLRTEIAN